MAKRLPGLNDAWTAFILCVMAHMLLPLLPLFMEWLITGEISKNSITITLAIYAMTIGASSTNSLIAIMCIFIGIIFSVLYGVTISANTEALNFDTMLLSKLALLAIVLPHLAERYNRHVVDLQPFKILGQK